LEEVWRRFGEDFGEFLRIKNSPACRTGKYAIIPHCAHNGKAYLHKTHVYVWVDNRNRPT
jgi:hypothetical protein